VVWTVTLNRFVVAEFDGPVPGMAVDIGCGDGRNTVWSAERGRGRSTWSSAATSGPLTQA
jgi:hypothetical protein